MNSINIDKKVFLTIFCLSVVFFFPVVLSHHYYVDDLGRSIYGYSNWAQNGRPVADILFIGLSFGPLLPDISPLPQIAALAVMSLCVYLTAKSFLKDSSIFAATIISLTLITSPFILENISYKYDAFPMAISILCAIVPFTLNTVKHKIQILLCLTSAILILCIYQATINIYVIFTILCVLNQFRNGKTRSGLLTTVISSGSLIVSYMIYSLFISPNFLVGSYNLRHSEIATSSLSDSIDVLLRNYESFGKIISLALTPTFYFLAIIVALLSIIGMVRIILTKDDSNTIERITKSLIVIFSPIIVVIMIPGPMMLLRDPVLSPRVLMAFGATTLFFAVLASWAFIYSKKYQSCIGIIFAVYFIYSLGLSYAYANSLNNQEKYENAIILMMLSDINSLDLNGETNIAFKGSVPLSPEGRMASKKYPLINMLIQPTINNQWVWGHTQMMHFDLKQKFQTFEYHMSLKSKLCKLKLERNSNNYNILLDDKESTIVFDFDKTNCTQH